MATKGSALSRTLRYFREADQDEARVAFVLVQEIMTGRRRAAGAGSVGSGKGKKHVKAASAGPKKTWSRRKKAVPPTAVEAPTQAHVPTQANQPTQNSQSAA